MSEFAPFAGKRPREEKAFEHTQKQRAPFQKCQTVNQFDWRLDLAVQLLSYRGSPDPAHRSPQSLQIHIPVDQIGEWFAIGVIKAIFCV